MVRAPRTFIALALAASGGAASARPGYAEWTWQISADDGATWNAGRVEVFTTQPSVRVRCWIDWDDPETTPYAFAGTQFDAVVEDAKPADFVRGFARPYHMDRGSTQTLAATRFGSQIKVDDSRDTNAPGAGTRGVFPAQLVEIYSEGHFTTAKPLSIFEFELVLDGTPGERSITDYPTLPSGGCGGRRVRVYTSPSGAQRAFSDIDPQCFWRNEIIWTPAELAVLPCPADFDSNRQIDFFDYLDFIAAFAASDPRADFSGDQQVDFFDYLDFTAQFATGCD